MILYSVTLLVSFSSRRMVFPSRTTACTSHLDSVKNRFMLLWSFLSVKSSLTLFTSCSFSPATISPSMTLQKFSYCGLVKYLLNPESRCLTLLGTPDRNPNMTPRTHHDQISSDTVRTQKRKDSVNLHYRPRKVRRHRSSEARTAIVRSDWVKNRHPTCITMLLSC